MLTVPREEWTDHYTYRVEKEGFEPQQGKLETSVGGGRITGGIFTFGLLFLLKQPTTFSQGEYQFNLYAIGEPRGSAADGDTARRLRRLDRLHEQGVISAEEYERQRLQIIDGL